MAPDTTPDVGAAGADPDKDKDLSSPAIPVATTTAGSVRVTKVTRTDSPVADDEGPEDTSGRPPLADVATERAAGRRVVDLDAEEER